MADAFFIRDGDGYVSTELIEILRPIPGPEHGGKMSAPLSGSGHEHIAPRPPTAGDPLCSGRHHREDAPGGSLALIPPTICQTPPRFIHVWVRREVVVVSCPSASRRRTFAR